jgi:hypothetical protein
MRWSQDSASAFVRADERCFADGKGVWFWHPWAGAKSRDDDLKATVTKKVMDTGESTQ